jgi:hypothetical protein
MAIRVNDGGAHSIRAGACASSRCAKDLTTRNGHYVAYQAICPMPADDIGLMTLQKITFDSVKKKPQVRNLTQIQLDARKACHDQIASVAADPGRRTRPLHC